MAKTMTMPPQRWWLALAVMLCVFATAHGYRLPISQDRDCPLEQTVLCDEQGMYCRRNDVVKDEENAPRRQLQDPLALSKASIQGYTCHTLGALQVSGGADAPPPPPPPPQPQWLDLSGGSTSQSSTFVGGLSARAIDGNLDPEWWGNSCSATHWSTSPWWQVQLAGETTVTAVQVTNRGDCCGERLNGLQVTVNGQLCASGVTFSQGETKVITCTTPVRGTDVRLQILGFKQLTLCEVKVKGW